MAVLASCSGTRPRLPAGPDQPDDLQWDRLEPRRRHDAPCPAAANRDGSAICLAAFCLAGRPPGYGGDRRVGLMQRLRCPGGWITALGGQRQAMHERPGQRQGDHQQQPHPQAPGEKCPHAQDPFVVPREVLQRYPPCPGLTTLRAACSAVRFIGGGGRHDSDARCETEGCPGCGRRRPGDVGGGIGQPPGRGTGAKRVAVRVFRASVDRGLAGPGDVAGAAAGPDRDGRPGTGLLPSLGGACRVGGQYAMFAASSRACSDSEDRAAISAALRVAL